MAMECAAGSYGRPYLWLLEQTGAPFREEMR